MEININCDLGESSKLHSIENDPLLLEIVNSANIACGYHAGDKPTMEKTIEISKKNKVSIGAHPSFNDPENFGRKRLNLPSSEIKKLIIDQINILSNVAVKVGVKVTHVKPHGALYNLIAINREKAEVVVNTIKKVFKDLKIYVPYNSVIADVAKENGLTILYEAFADRNYNDDLTLVSRQEPNATMTDPTEIIDHVSRMFNYRKVQTLSGKQISIEADTFCIHGDNKNVVKILQVLNERFL